jgi:hypothetical protein
MVDHVGRVTALKICVVGLVNLLPIAIVSKRAVLLDGSSPLRGTTALSKPTGAQTIELLPELESLLGLLLLLYDILYLLLLKPSLTSSVNYEAIIINVDILNSLYVQDSSILLFLRVLRNISVVISDQDFLAFTILVAALRRSAKLPQRDVGVESLLSLFN